MKSEGKPGLQAAFFGKQGWRLVDVRDGGYYYQTMLAQFISMVETGVMPIPLEETLEIIEILAAGKVMNIPVADELGNVAVRPAIRLTLACDHRVVDGSEAAPFLTAVQKSLESFHE